MEKKRIRPMKWILRAIGVLIAAIPVFLCTMLFCFVRFGTVDAAGFLDAGIRKGDTYYCVRNGEALQEGDLVLYCNEMNEELLQVVVPHYSGEGGTVDSMVLVKDHAGNTRTVALNRIWGKVKPCEALFKIGDAFFPKFHALSVLE